MLFKYTAWASKCESATSLPYALEVVVEAAWTLSRYVTAARANSSPEKM